MMQIRPAEPNDPDMALRAEWSADQRRRFMIHHPEIAPEKLAVNYPAHLHLNLLPRLQGQGAGTQLLNTWMKKSREVGVTRVHVRANRHNRGAVSFWAKTGFKTLDGMFDVPDDRNIWLGRST